MQQKHNQFSAKITVIVYILICFEIGLMLLILPWTRYWWDNFFLYFVTGKLNAPGAVTLLNSGWVKGLVSGLGIVNILAGIWDIVKFRQTVAQMAGGTPTMTSASVIQNPQVDEPQTTIPYQTTTDLPDHRPPGAPPQA